MQILRRKLSKHASSVALLALGLGLGTGGTLLLQAIALPPTNEPAEPQKRIQPKLTTDLLL